MIRAERECTCWTGHWADIVICNVCNNRPAPKLTCGHCGSQVEHPVCDLATRVADLERRVIDLNATNFELLQKMQQLVSND